MQKTIKFKKELEFNIPTIPNFITIKRPAEPRQNGFSPYSSTPIYLLTDDELIQIADAWKALLLESARDKRKSLNPEKLK